MDAILPAAPQHVPQLVQWPRVQHVVRFQPSSPGLIDPEAHEIKLDCGVSIG